MTEDFVEGYACALSCIVKGHGVDTAVVEALVAMGLTAIRKLREAGVDDYDIEILRPAVKEAGRKRKTK